VAADLLVPTWKIGEVLTKQQEIYEAMNVPILALLSEAENPDYK